MPDGVLSFGSKHAQAPCMACHHRLHPRARAAAAADDIAQLRLRPTIIELVAAKTLRLEDSKQARIQKFLDGLPGHVAFGLCLRGPLAQARHETFGTSNHLLEV